MNDDVNRPHIPGYVSVKEAAEMLGLADRTVYEFVEEGRLSSVQAADIILIPTDEVKNFKREPSGRPRKNTPSWRISSGENSQFVTLIFVKIRADQHDELTKKLEQIRKSKAHIFPGTVARTIIENKTGQIVIMLIWRGAVMPDEAKREEALEAFRQELADVLDWSTAQYNHGTVLMHT
jgi:excisionase family DNA binding protein